MQIQCTEKMNKKLMVLVFFISRTNIFYIIIFLLQLYQINSFLTMVKKIEVKVSTFLCFDRVIKVSPSYSVVLKINFR